MHRCRHCNEPLTHTFADLGRQPPSNALLDDPEKGEMIYPLHAYVCDKCFLVQVPAVVAREKIFNDHYAYFSSNSKVFLAQCKKYVERMSEMLAFIEKPLVVEIASNDGYLLQYFKEMGISVVGVEPAANVAKVAIDKGIYTIVKFFGSEIAKTFPKKADLIIANNVLAHTPYLHDFIEGIRILLAPNGTATIEFPWLLNLIHECQFDTIYHEHFSYFSLTTVQKIFWTHRLKIFNIEVLPNLGGSVRLFVAHYSDPRPIVSDVAGFYAKEYWSGLTSLPTYDRFAGSVARVKDELLTFLLQARRDGKTVAGYGAPAKATVLLNYCGIGTDLLPYTVDTTPYKQGKFIPGTGQTIYHPEVLPKERPDYLLIFPWNLKKEIIENISAQVHEWGGKFVTAIPRLEVVDA